MRISYLWANMRTASRAAVVLKMISTQRSPPVINVSASRAAFSALWMTITETMRKFFQPGYLARKVELMWVRLASSNGTTKGPAEIITANPLDFMWCPGPELNPPQILADFACRSTGKTNKRRGILSAVGQLNRTVASSEKLSTSNPAYFKILFTLSQEGGSMSIFSASITVNLTSFLY